MFEPIQLILDSVIIGATYDPDLLIISEDDDLLDLSAATVTMTIHDGENTIKTLSEGSGITVATGAIAIGMTAAETAVLIPGDYSWYLSVAVGSEVYRYTEGRIKVRA